MGKETKITWCDATWNAFMGCTKVTAECVNCYAERDMKRYGRDPHKVVVAKDATFYAPLHWKEPKRVFVCSWSDFFHKDIPQARRDEAWDIMVSANRHIYIILTKRPENIVQMLPRDWMGWPECYQHVWFLVSAGTNESLQRFWPILRDIPGLAVRGISMEPLLESIDLNILLVPMPGVRPLMPEWLIVAGESGPKRRPMNPDWARQIRDWCQDWHKPFFFKGHIGNVHTPENEMLEGKVYHEFPRGQR